MEIYAWQKESSHCYEGKKSAVIFTPDCSNNCGYCHHQHKLEYTQGKVDEGKIFEYLNSNKGRIEGVVISGEETTNQPGLVDFVKQVKDLGFLVKLYTNGAKLDVLQELKNGKTPLVDFMSLDVKGPAELYPLIMKKKLGVMDNIGKSISLVSQFPENEYRTNLSIVYGEDDNPRWIKPEEIGETAKLIRNWALSLKVDDIKYFLQTFNATNSKKTKEKFMKANLPEEFHRTPQKHIEECLIEAKKYIPNTGIRR